MVTLIVNKKFQHPGKQTVTQGTRKGEAGNNPSVDNDGQNDSNRHLFVLGEEQREQGSSFII